MQVSKSGLLYFGGYIVFCALLSATMLFIGCPRQDVCPWDTFVMFEGAWKLVYGYVPHVDYYSPVGPVTSLIIAAGMEISSDSINSIVIGFVVAGAPLALICWFLYEKKMPPIYCFAFCLFIMLNWLSPFPYRSFYWQGSYAGLYNREACTFLMLLMVVLLGEENIPDKRLRLDNFVAGSILGLTLFTKINYFAAALALLPISLFKHPSPFLRIWWIAFGFAASSLAIMMPLHINPILMFGDFRMVTSARSLYVIVASIYAIYTDAFPMLIMFYSIAFMELLLFLKRKRGISRLRDLSLAELPFIALATILAIYGNSPDGFNIGMPVLQIYGLLMVKKIADNRELFYGSMTEFILRNTAIAACVICYLAGVFLNICGIGFCICYRLLGADSGLHLAFVIPNSDKREYMQVTDSGYYQAVTDGMDLLARHPDLRDRSLGSLSFSNPFAFALKRPPAPGMPTCWQFGRTFSYTIYPDPKKIFKGCDCLMVSEEERALLKIYNAYIIQNYVLCDKTKIWTLYVKKNVTPSHE